MLVQSLFVQCVVDRTTFMCVRTAVSFTANVLIVLSMWVIVTAATSRFAMIAQWITTTRRGAVSPAAVL